MTRSVLVTGGNRGIGLAIATAFAEAGDKVAVTYRTGTPPPGLFGVRCDVTEAASVGRAFEEIKAQQGAVQVLVANAGFSRDNLFATLDDADFTDVMDTNFMGAVRAARAAVPDMIRARWGRLIFVSSTTAFWGSGGASNYAASKSALVGLARSLAWELGRRNITSNVVAPGLIDTDLTADIPTAVRERVLNNTPLGRTGTAAEVAPPVRFLASAEASYITGAVLAVGGGMAMGH
ncbi:SDR family oxidoreductase [Nocardia pseudovaccinii]|uniref:SDR family oxidoreductase n=1 Tax=Nocardia pseudovaccinii TaxID=189540 RepID=UPI003D8C6DCC